MPVSGPNAILVSDQYIRPMADKLAQEYDGASRIVQRWNALGAGSAANTVMSGQIAALANFFEENDGLIFQAENVWAGFGAALIPAGGGIIQDTAPGDGRPQITADQAIAVVTAWRQRMNWAATNTATFASTAPVSSGGQNRTDFIASAHAPTLTRNTTCVSHWTDLVTQYQASSNLILNSLLVVAVNATLHG